MKHCYPVLFAGRRVGEVSLQPQGTQQLCRCRCDLSGAVMMDLYISQGGKVRRIGVPALSADGYSILWREGCSWKEDATVSFFLKPRRSALEGNYSPPHPDWPQRYLKRLERQFLQAMDGKMQSGGAAENNGQKVEINA